MLRWNSWRNHFHQIAQTKDTDIIPKNNSTGLRITKKQWWGFPSFSLIHHALHRLETTMATDIFKSDAIILLSTSIRCDPKRARFIERFQLKVCCATLFLSMYVCAFKLNACVRHHIYVECVMRQTFKHCGKCALSYVHYIGVGVFCGIDLRIQMEISGKM